MKIQKIMAVAATVGLFAQASQAAQVLNAHGPELALYGTADFHWAEQYLKGTGLVPVLVQGTEAQPRVVSGFAVSSINDAVVTNTADGSRTPMVSFDMAVGVIAVKAPGDANQALAYYYFNTAINNADAIQSHWALSTGHVYADAYDPISFIFGGIGAADQVSTKGLTFQVAASPMITVPKVDADGKPITDEIRIFTPGAAPQSYDLALTAPSFSVRPFNAELGDSYAAANGSVWTEYLTQSGFVPATWVAVEDMQVRQSK